RPHHPTPTPFPYTTLFRSGQKDFSALVTKIKASGCTAVFYGGYSPEAGLLRKQMTQAGLTSVTLVGGDGIKDDTFLSTAGSAGEDRKSTRLNSSHRTISYA